MADSTIRYLDLDGYAHNVGKIIDYVEGKHEVVVSTNPVASAALTGTCSRLKSLSNGTRIVYQTKFPVAGDATLALTMADGTTLPATPVYSSGGERLGPLPAGAMVPMTYALSYDYGAATVTNVWVADSDNPEPLTNEDIEALLVGAGY